jgi:hypothetical protein
MAEFPGFIGQGYTARALAFDAQRTMNLYLEADESGTGKFPRALMGSPGLKLLQTLPTLPVRGVWTGLIDNLPGSSGTDLAYAVAGSKLYQITLTGSTWGYTLIGDVGTDATNSPCTFQVNGSQLLISSAGYLWVWTNSVLSQAFFNDGTGTVNTTTTAVTWESGSTFDVSQVGSYILIAGTAYLISAFIDELHITLSSSAGSNTGATFYVLTGAGATPVYVQAAQTAFLDTYGIALPPGSKLYFISAINNFLDWNPLDFGAKAAFPDNIAAILADHEELWLFGSEASEVDQDTGGSSVSTFPFQRNPGGIVSQGCRAPFTVCSANNGVFFVGGTTQGNPIAWFAPGIGSLQRVSTHAIEAAWSEYSTITDAISFVYVQDGHQVVRISFPTANATWEWDATAGTWNECGWWNGTSIDRHRAAYHGYVFGIHLVGDWQNGNLYQLSPDVYDDAGVAIHRIRTAPHMSGEELRTFYSCLRLAMASGPIPAVAWSDDYGVAYTAALRGNKRALTSSTGTTLAQFWELRRMGYGRDRIYSLVIAPVAGAVTASGKNITWASGDKFTGIQPGDPFAIAGTTYTVATVTDATHLALTANGASGAYSSPPACQIAIMAAYIYASGGG